MEVPNPDILFNTEHTIAKYKMVEAGDRVLVGVSGGADSVSLILVLKKLGYEIGIGHLNHGLRGVDSDGDEQFVSELASDLGVPFYSQRISERERNVSPRTRSRLRKNTKQI